MDHNWWGDVPRYDHWEDARVCDRCGGDGWIDFLDGDGSDRREGSPREENHPITCCRCNGTREVR